MESAKLFKSLYMGRNMNSKNMVTVHIAVNCNIRAAMGTTDERLILINLSFSYRLKKKFHENIWV